jgi:hypothetical protein
MNLYKSEHEPLDELLQNRDSFKLDFQKASKALDDRKDILFKNRDFRTWGYT